MSNSNGKNLHTTSRGRNAWSPRHIDLKGWRDIALRVKETVVKDNLGLLAAGVAFYFLLSIVPMLAAFLSIYGLLVDPGEAREQVAALVGVIPAEARSLLMEQTDQLTSGSDSALGFGALISVLVALWSARRGTNAMMMALNVAYNEENTRGFIRHLLLTFALTLGLIIFFVLSLAIVAAAPVAFKILGVGAVAEAALDLLRWPILAMIAVLALAFIYRFGPDRNAARWRWITPGAVLAVMVWLITSGLFSWYVSGFGNYNEMYGSLGTVVILLLWFYITAYIFLLGAELNAEMEHQTRQDTTVDGVQPMGERGAFVADNLGKKP